MQKQIAIGDKVTMVFYTNKGDERMPGTVVAMCHSGFGRITVQNESGYRYTFTTDFALRVHGLLAAKIEVA